MEGVFLSYYALLMAVEVTRGFVYIGGIFRRLKMSRSRKFVFTWNNYPADDVFNNTLDSLGAVYLCYGKELAPTTRTPHLQGFLYFTNALSLGSLRSKLPGVDLRVARGTSDQCIAYCSKDGIFSERGDRPLSHNDKGDKERMRWATALELARLGTFDEIEPQILIGHYSSLRRIHSDFLPSPVDNDELSNFWIIGRSGIGKSRMVRTKFPGLYPKPLNKWWDVYSGEREFLLDDVDPNHGIWLGSFLKIWSDHYPFVAEIKGRSQTIRPLVCCVTSQYSILEVFKEEKLVEAISRRFKVINLDNNETF